MSSIVQFFHWCHPVEYLFSLLVYLKLEQPAFCWLSREHLPIIALISSDFKIGPDLGYYNLTILDPGVGHSQYS